MGGGGGGRGGGGGTLLGVSLNNSGGVRLIKPAKLYMCTQNTGQTHGAGCAWPWFLTAEPLRECHYENLTLPTFLPFLLEYLHENL